MKYVIDLTDSPKDKMILSLLKELNVPLKNSADLLNPLTAKDVALGLSRKVSQEEIKEYADRAEQSESLDIHVLMESFGK